SLPEILTRYQDSLFKDWISLQSAASPRRLSATEERQLASESREFVSVFLKAAQTGNLTDITKPEWTPVREFLTAASASRAKAGATPVDTAVFIFSLKEPLFTRLRQEIGEGLELAEEIWSATRILDRLGLFTMEAFQK